jgi:protein-disulfide isomerase
MSEALRTKNQEFKNGNRLKILMAEPEAPQVNIDTAGYPSRGTGSATLVEASDYLCPHCQMMQAEVDAVTKEMADKIKFVQVNFSLKPDGLSGALARGGYCAQKLGNDQFWKYHEKAFETAKAKGWKQSDPAANEPVAEVATAAGLDAAAITACIATPDATAAVQKAVDAMNAAGITGTPTFFLNGRKLHMHGGGLKESLTSAMSGSSH